MPKNKIITVKSFLATFAIAALGFVVIFSYMVANISVTLKEEEMDAYALAEGVYLPTTEQDFAVLLMIDSNTKPLLAGVLKISPLKGDVELITLNENEISDAYTTKGVQGAMSSVVNMGEALPSRYMHLDVEVLTELFEESIECEISEEMTVAGITLFEGNNILDIYTASSILSEKDAFLSREQYESTSRAIVNELIVQFFNNYSEENFLQLISKSSTDISYMDYIQSEATMNFLLKLRKG